MASANSKGEKSEGSLFCVSEIPNITSEILNGKNYLAWSTSIELWFLKQGHYDHLDKSLDEISEKERDLWKKVDYQLCSLLWQSVEPDILVILRSFKTCRTFWKKAQNVYGYDTQGLYESAKKLVALKQRHHDMISYVSKAQSVVKEVKTYIQADTLEELKNKCDNLLKNLVLQGMHPDYEQYRRQILTSQELPSMENLFIRLLQAPFIKPGGNSTDNIRSSANGSIQGNREGHGAGASKRSRREGSTPRPLPGALFGTEFHVGNKINFHMNSVERAIIEQMSEKDIIDSILELSSRAAMLNWYMREFADRRDAELAEERKASAELRARLEAVTATHEGCEKHHTDLQMKLDEARRERKKAVEKARVIQLKGDRAVEEYKKLKGKMDEQDKKEHELLTERAKLAIENKALKDKLAKAEAKLTELNESVVIEHEEGFYKALRQVVFFLGVDHLAKGFDIMKEVYEGKLISLNEMPDNFGLDDLAANEVADRPDVVPVEARNDQGVGEE